MINLGVLIFGIIITRGFFATLPMMFPRVDKEIYLPYELWLYALVVFLCIYFESRRKIKTHVTNTL